MCNDRLKPELKLELNLYYELVLKLRIELVSLLEDIAMGNSLEDTMKGMHKCSLENSGCTNLLMDVVVFLLRSLLESGER